MRAVGFRGYGGPEVLEVVELRDPEPGPGEVLVRVAAATVNPADALFRSGGLGAAIGGEPPWVAGLELAGIVEAGDGFAAGERVAAMTTFIPAGRGAQTELVVLPASAAIARVPDGLDLLEAATVPMSGLTARLLLDTLDLSPGATLAVTGAGGAVGGFVVELAAREGLAVVAVASPEDEPLARALGAAGFVPRGPGAAAAVRDLTGGADGLVDAAVIGAQVLPAVRDGGRIGAVRAFAGAPERGILVEHVSVRRYLHEPQKLRDLLDAGLHLRVAETFPPERAAEAHARLEAGGTRGRLVLTF